MTLKTRQPSGKVSYPLVLLAGEAGSGKTWAAVEATAMEEVDRAFFLEIGESQADEYGAVPGADFEIIEHSGALGEIRQAIFDASQVPAEEGKYNLLIIDSATELWQMLKDEAQAAANARRRGRRNPNGDYSVSMDLWNRANDTWEGIVRQLRQFPGLVIVTARMKITAIVNDDGQPTGGKDFKIEAQKNLHYRAQAVVEARSPRVWTLTKIATTVPELQLQPGKETQFNDFSVAKLVRTMGVGADTAVANFAGTQVTGALTDEAESAMAQQGRNMQRQHQQAPQQRQNQQQPQVSREEYVSRFANKLLEHEKVGDLEKVQGLKEWASKANDQQLARMASSTYERMMTAGQQQEAAPEPVQEALQEAAA